MSENNRPSSRRQRPAHVTHGTLAGGIALLAVVLSVVILLLLHTGVGGWLAAALLWLACALIWRIAATDRGAPHAGATRVDDPPSPQKQPTRRMGNEQPTEIVSALQARAALQSAPARADAKFNPDDSVGGLGHSTRRVKMGDTAPGDIPSPAATRKIKMGDPDAAPTLLPTAPEEESGPEEQLTGGAEPSWREMVRRLPFDLYTVDADGVVHYTHQLPDHGFGLRVGSLLSDLVRLDQTDLLRDSLRLCLETQRRQRLELAAAAIAADATERWLSLELAPLGLPQGSDQRHLLVVAQDVTEQRMLAERQHTGQRLEALGRLTSGVGHDFNNILTIVHCNALLLQDAMPEDAPELEEILTAVDRATRLTHQLLAFSKSREIKTRVLNLNDAVDNLLRMLRRLVGENIELDMRGEEKLWHIRADLTQIDQVVMNLVVNARDAMPRGGRILLRTTNVLLEEDRAHTHGTIPAGDYVALEVTDTGEGISAEALGHIFEPYFSTKSAGQGYGLGLATVRSILTNAGGDITCRSTEHVGTTFTVYFPVFTGESSHVSSIEEPPASVPSAATILLVEDEDAVRDVASRILKRNGYEVLTASRGSEARSICREYPHTIDLLFTDVVMPDINGAELSEAILSMRPDIRILFTSGYTETVRVEQGDQIVPIQFLPKPYTAAALSAKIADILNRERAPGIGASAGSASGPKI